MIKDVYLYGDIVPFVYGLNEIDLTTFISNINKLGLTKEDTLRVGIHTLGGCTVTAFAIYNYLRRLVNNGEIKNVITRVDGYCASSGVIALLAGDIRIGNKFANPFVHEAWTYLDSGNATELKKVAEDLSRTNNQIATLYANTTTITTEIALDLMVQNTWVSVEDCLKYGFYTEIENVEGAEASRETFNSLRSGKGQAVNNTKLNKMSKPKSIFNQLKDLVKSFQNKMILDSAGVEIDFYELEDGDTPSVGDVATIDGKPAGDYNDGSVTLTDGTVYKFSGEELTEVIAPEQAPENTLEDEGDDEDAKDKEIAELKKKIEELTTSNSAKEATFNKLQTKFNKVKTERDASRELLVTINSIKDDQLKNILDGNEPAELETEDTDDTDDEDENGFPAKPQTRTQQNSLRTEGKKTELGGLLAEINLNMMSSNRK